MIQFEEKEHIYSRNGARYISVTQLIDRYVPPFDGEYWSLYKAIKDVLEARGLFRFYKVDAGGWRNVVGLFRREGTGDMAIDSLVVDRQLWYLDAWGLKNKLACEKGSAIHNELEGAVNHAKQVEVDRYKLVVSQGNLRENNKILRLDDLGIHTERYLWNDEFQIAGKGDLIIVPTFARVRIKDYKTNEKITTEAFDNQVLLHPLQHIPSTKYHIYCLQLSLYGWMLEQWGFRVEDLELIHVTANDNVPMKLHYLKPEVEEMVKHWRDTKENQVSNFDIKKN